MRYGLTGMLMLISATAFALEADKTQSLEQLQAKAKSYLEQKLTSVSYGKIEVKPGKLDPRLRLAYCPEELIHAYIPNNSHPSTTSIVGMRCESDTPWSLFVPVKIRILAQAYVTLRPLNKGERLRASNVKQKTLDVSLLKHGYYQDMAKLRGRVLKHSMQADRPITPFDIVTEKVVKRGDKVTIVANSNGIKVSMRGLAMSAGSLGDTIRVRSLSNKRVLQGKIVNKQTVEVSL